MLMDQTSRVKKSRCQFTFIENIFHPQENKQTKKIIKKNWGCQMDIRKTNSDYEIEKDNLQIFTFKKCFKTTSNL